MIKVLISGALGAMGKVVYQSLVEQEEIKAVCGFDVKKDLTGDFPIYDNLDDIKEDIDKVINNEVINDTDTLESDVLLKENNEVKYDKRDDIVVNKKEVAETVDINKDDKVENTSIFNINEDSETYGTLLVYIVRENETINSIITKYNTTIEELEKYNDLKDLSIGTKLIIPLVNEWCYK